jgi:dipeptidyl aminopeptidase/acylaminoacyl peptidase
MCDAKILAVGTWWLALGGLAAQTAAPTDAAAAPLTAPSQSAAPFVVSGRRELDAGLTGPLPPQWSPDGRWIACGLPKAGGIRLLRADGSAAVDLTTDTGSGHQFRWSPDSTQIAWRARVEGKTRAYVIRAAQISDGKILSVSPEDADCQPPAWETQDGAMRWAAWTPRGILRGPWQPCGSPGLPSIHTPIVRFRLGRLFLAGETSGPQALTPLNTGAGAHFAWSPDKSAIACDDGGRICVRTVLPGTPASLDAAPQMLGAGQHATWSPDGAWIAFQITQDHVHAEGDTRQHTTDTLPHIHDDKTNHRIVESDIWLSNRDGSQRFALTQTPGILEVDPAWSPDGAAILCREENSAKLILLSLEKR